MSLIMPPRFTIRNLIFYLFFRAETAKSLELDNKNIIASAFKMAEDGDGQILRLYNSKPVTQKVNINIPMLGLNDDFELAEFEVATFKIDGEFIKTDLNEA